MFGLNWKKLCKQSTNKTFTFKEKKYFFFKSALGPNMFFI